MTDDSSNGAINRRTLFAGAAGLATLAMTDPAAAQRCPATPPARTKGPAIWLDLDQQDVDEMYDQNVYAFNYQNIGDRQKANNEIALSIIGKAELVPYGSADIEKVAIHRTKRPNAPIMVFIHGGSWRAGRATDFAVYAESFINAGAHFVAVDFSSVTQTNGDLMPMVDQCRRAIAWVYKNAASFGGDPERIYICGRSSGSHLGGCMVITEWEKYGVPLTVMKGALLGSGMYDLRPVRLSKRGQFVKFTDEMIDALSAQMHIDRIHTPLVLVHGTLETPEFQRQTREFAAAVQAAGKPVKLVVAKGYNHFEVGETIGHPYAVLGRAALSMMNLSMG